MMQERTFRKAACECMCVGVCVCVCVWNVKAKCSASACAVRRLQRSDLIRRRWQRLQRTLSCRIHGVRKYKCVPQLQSEQLLHISKLLINLSPKVIEVEVWFSGNIVGRVHQWIYSTSNEVSILLRWMTFLGLTILAFNPATQVNSAWPGGHPRG